MLAKKCMGKMVRRQKTGNFLCINFYKTETMAVERRREED
jgi:hypothetical protein